MSSRQLPVESEGAMATLGPSLVDQTAPFPALVMQYIQCWGRERSGPRDYLGPIVATPVYRGLLLLNITGVLSRIREVKHASLE